MAIHFPDHPFNDQDRRFARTSEFRVTDIEALRLALSHYPNIVIHEVYGGRGGCVRLTTKDGTWYTGFVNGEEGSIVDELVTPLLREREVVHMYQIVLTPIGLDTARFSFSAGGQYSYSTTAQNETDIATQLLSNHHS